METPLIADYQGDVVMFDSVDAAERYIEADDVSSGNVRGFDATGTPLILSVVGGRSGSAGVRITAGDRGEPAELRQALISFLGQLTDDELIEVPLAELINRIRPLTLRA